MQCFEIFGGANAPNAPLVVRLVQAYVCGLSRKDVGRYWPQDTWCKLCGRFTALSGRLVLLIGHLAFVVGKLWPKNNWLTKPLLHKCTVWGYRGCGHIPNAEKLAIIWAKIFNIWAKYTATFTCKWGSVYFPN